MGKGPESGPQFRTCEIPGMGIIGVRQFPVGEDLVFVETYFLEPVSPSPDPERNPETHFFIEHNGQTHSCQLVGSRLVRR